MNHIESGTNRYLSLRFQLNVLGIENDIKHIEILEFLLI